MDSIQSQNANSSNPNLFIIASLILGLVPNFILFLPQTSRMFNTFSNGKKILLICLLVLGMLSILAGFLAFYKQRTATFKQRTLAIIGILLGFVSLLSSAMLLFVNYIAFSGF